MITTILIIYLFLGLCISLHTRHIMGSMPLLMWLYVIVVGPMGWIVRSVERIKF